MLPPVVVIATTCDYPWRIITVDEQATHMAALKKPVSMVTSLIMMQSSPPITSADSTAHTYYIYGGKYVPSVMKESLSVPLFMPTNWYCSFSYLVLEFQLAETSMSLNWNCYRNKESPYFALQTMPKENGEEKGGIIATILDLHTNTTYHFYTNN